MSRAGTAIAVVCSMLFGLLLYRHDVEERHRFDALSRRLDALSCAGAPPSTPRAAVGVVDSAYAEAIAKMVAARLRAEAAPAVASTGDATPAPKQRAETAAQQAAFSSANRVVDQALSRGNLSRDDVIEMRRLLAQNDDVELHRELALRIAVAINAGKLVPEDRDFVFP